ncbi:putative metalloprotease [Neobacillus sp. B4I6]
MKWKGRRQSANVEDRRGMGMGGKTVIGGGIGSTFFLSKKSRHLRLLIHYFANT